MGWWAIGWLGAGVLVLAVGCGSDEAGPTGAAALCGDGVCNGAEDTNTCPGDCPATVCGDGVCEAGELFSCPSECYCGNGTCDPGEALSSCPDDCRCGNGLCEAGEDEECGFADFHCGN